MARRGASITTRARIATAGPSAACGRSRTKASTAERCEELDDFPGERARLLERREVPALLHHRPAPDIGVGLLGERARRAQDFLRELGVAHRHADRLERPGPVQ